MLVMSEKVADLAFLQVTVATSTSSRRYSAMDGVAVAPKALVPLPLCVSSAPRSGIAVEHRPRDDGA